MYIYELNIQLEDLGAANIPKQMNNVYYQNIDGRLCASTKFEVESKDEISKESLQESIHLLHEAVLRLNFIYGTKISLAENGYIVNKLFDVKYPWTTPSIISSGYSIGVDHGLPKNPFSDACTDCCCVITDVSNTVIIKAAIIMLLLLFFIFYFTSINL